MQVSPFTWTLLLVASSESYDFQHRIAKAPPTLWITQLTTSGLFSAKTADFITRTVPDTSTASFWVRRIHFLLCRCYPAQSKFVVIVAGRATCINEVTFYGVNCRSRNRSSLIRCSRKLPKEHDVAFVAPLHVSPCRF